MTLGPSLPDGSRSLILVSNNAMNAEESTQFLLFRLTSGPQYPRGKSNA